MKRAYLKILCLLMAMLMLFAACGDKNGTQGTDEGTTTSSDPTGTASTYKITDFQLVRSDTGSQTLTTKVVELNNAIKAAFGTSLKIKTDLMAADEIACEILIGSTKRTQSAEKLANLGEGDYVIETVVTDTGVKLVVGGKDDQSTLFAIDELIIMITQGQITEALSTLSIKGKAYTGLPESEVNKMVILYDSGASTMVANAAKNLWKSVRKVGGESVTFVAGNAETSLEQYPYALIVGKVGSRAVEMTTPLISKQHRIKVERTDSSYRVWMVGVNDYEIIRAVQDFYTRSVSNGKLSLPITLDLKITSALIRDPCIVLHNNRYYVYENAGMGYGVRWSDDLLTWSARSMAFTPPANFPGTQSFWAPECHKYNGAFYIFGTYYDGNTQLRGTAIFKSDSPMGPFEVWSDGFITPKDRHSIDGTLYVEDGVPYMVYVDEWPNYGSDLNHSASSAKGRMAYVQLTPDLKGTVGEHHTDLFKASDPEWTNYGITDGCYMYRCENGKLLMIWSNRDSNGAYCVGVAISSNGKITGEWSHTAKPLFTSDNTTVYSVTEGGHGMIFKDRDGRMFLTLHTPNQGEDTAMILIPIIESDGMLYIDVVK